MVGSVILVVGHLGDIRILAKAAFEITSDRGYGKGIASWKKMKQGFLFNGVHVPGYDLAINQAHQCTALVFPYPANPPFPLPYQAVVATEKTPDPLMLHFFV
jgi:hypothetical protein